MNEVWKKDKEIKHGTRFWYPPSPAKKNGDSAYFHETTKGREIHRLSKCRLRIRGSKTPPLRREVHFHLQLSLSLLFFLFSLFFSVCLMIHLLVHQAARPLLSSYRTGHQTEQLLFRSNRYIVMVMSWTGSLHEVSLIWIMPCCSW